MNLENITEAKDALRGFEREMAKLYVSGGINGPAHFAIGNEVPLIKIFRGLREGDYVHSSQLELSPESIEAMQGRCQIEVHDSADSGNPLFKGVRGLDWIFASYRNHLQALLHGVPREWLKENIINGKLAVVNFRQIFNFEDYIGIHMKGKVS